MNSLCVIQCGKRKIWDKSPGAGPTQARDVYIGPFTKKCREYAETFYPTSWCILSAKYGFLLPEDIVPKNYNVTFKKKETKPIAVRDLRSQVKAKEFSKYDQIVVLGGKQYAQIIKNTFSRTEVLLPLSDCKGIGFMMRKLNQAFEKANCL